MLMKHFTRFSHASLIILYTPDVTCNSRLRNDGKNIFRANILLNDKTRKFRFLILKLQVLNGKSTKTVKLPDNNNMR